MLSVLGAFRRENRSAGRPHIIHIGPCIRQIEVLSAAKPHIHKVLLIVLAARAEGAGEARCRA